MADDIIKTKRITAYDEATSFETGDWIFVDNADTGTRKISAETIKNSLSTDAQIAAIEEKGQEVLDSIPDNYSELNYNVEGLKTAIGYISNNLVTKCTPGGNHIYYYPTKVGVKYRFKTLGADGNVSCYASEDGNANTYLIFSALNTGEYFFYEPSTSYDYIKVYRSNSNADLQLYVSEGEIVDATEGSEYLGSEQYETLGESINSQFNLIGEKISEKLDNDLYIGKNRDVIISKNGTSINLSSINDFAFLNAIKIEGKTIQESGVPTPSSRKTIAAGVSPDGQGKYDYSFSLVLKNGQTISKTIKLDSPLYDGDYIELLSGKVYRCSYELILDGSKSYSRQVFSSKARFSVSAPKAKESTTGLCDALLVNGSPLSNMDTDLTITCYSGGQSAFFVFNQYTTVDSLKEYLTSNPIKYIYPTYEQVVENVKELSDIKKYMYEISSITCNSGTTVEYVSKAHDGGYVYVGRRVGYNSSGDYTSILRALKETPYETTVIVGRGTYDIVEEYKEYYGNSFWDNYTGYGDGTDKFLRGLWIGFGRKIIFDPFSKVIFEYTGSNSLVRAYFSPFATGGSGCIDGLHLTFNIGCRYAVHDDFAESDGEFIFRNCVFNGQASSDTIGAGCGQSNRYLIEKCIFTGSTSADHDDISYHNSGWSTGKCQIIVKDCHCENGIHFKWFGTSEDITECIVTNCKARRIVCGPHTATPHDVENMTLYQWNNIVTEGN